MSILGMRALALLQEALAFPVHWKYINRAERQACSGSNVINRVDLPRPSTPRRSRIETAWQVRAAACYRLEPV